MVEIHKADQNFFGMIKNGCDDSQGSKIDYIS